MSKKRIAILDSVCNDGQEVLSIIRSFPNDFQLEVLTASAEPELIIAQAVEFKPNHVVVINEDLYDQVESVLWEHDIKVYAGLDAVSQIVEMNSIQMVINCMDDLDGIKPSLTAIDFGKTLLIGNSQPLLVAGLEMTDLARKKAVNILPFNSRHSSLFQALNGDFENRILRVSYTFSEEKHNLLNLLTETIESKFLFGLKPDQLDVISHPQGILDALIQFEDGTVKSIFSKSERSNAIRYALSYPKRLSSNSLTIPMISADSWTFEEADLKTVKILELAKQVIVRGGNSSVVVNAVIQLIREEFHTKDIDILTIIDVIGSCLQKVTFVQQPSYEDYVATDLATRQLAKELFKP